MVTEIQIITNLTQLDFFPIEEELTESKIKARWKELCKVYHPDATNYSTFQDGDKQAKVNAAKDFLLENLEIVNYYIRKINKKLTEEDLRKEREAAEKREKEAAARRAQEEQAKRTQQAEQEQKRRAEEEKLRAAQAEAERLRKETERLRREAAANRAQTAYTSSASTPPQPSYTYSTPANNAPRTTAQPATKSASPSHRGLSIAINKKVVIGIVAAVLVVVLIVVLFATGFAQSCINGSPDSASNSGIEIKDRQSLLSINEKADENYVLTADINLSGEDWTPIPSFSGKLNGNGFTISGLTMTALKTDYAGLFQSVEKNAVIENIKLKDINISTSNTAKGVGGLAGKNAGMIKNCDVSGTVSLAGCSNIGGIAGVILDSSKKIESCTFNGTINGASNVGGIIGTDNESGLSVTGCTAGGKISGHSGVGGIVGYCASSTGINCTVENNANNAEITGGGENVGGIAGRIYSGSNWGSGTVSVSGNTNSGKVTGKNNTAGIVGNLGHSDYTKISFSSCTNTGAIEGEDYVGGIVGIYNKSASLTGMKSGGGVNGKNYVGGYVGSASYATISSAKNADIVTGGTHVGGIAGEISACTDCENVAQVTSTFSVDNLTALGGIAGRASTVKSCINRGRINASTIGNGVGGIAGMQQSGRALEITNCENFGAIELGNAISVGGIIGDITYGGLSDAPKALVSGCTNYADITVEKTGNYIAGILGRYQDTGYSLTHKGIEITSCTSSGNITADNSEYVAGIIGYSKGNSATFTALTVSGTLRGKAKMGKIGALIANCNNIGDFSHSFDVTKCTAKSLDGSIVPEYTLQTS